MVSELTPIRSFGAYSTAGLLLTASLILLLAPTMLALWRAPVFRAPKSAHRGAKRGVCSRSIFNWLVETLARQQRLAELRRIETKLRECSQVSGSISARTFMPALPTRPPANPDEALAMQRSAAGSLAEAER